MTAARRFPGPALDELARAKILGVRAWAEHRYTAVWVVVEGRAFVRPWNDEPTGWYRAFLAKPLGSIQLGGREIQVRGRRLRSERLRDAVTRAYAEKYDTKASERWVSGFAEPGRAATTLESSCRCASPRDHENGACDGYDEGQAPVQAKVVSQPLGACQPASRPWTTGRPGCP
jgi:hypothetical protein